MRFAVALALVVVAASSVQSQPPTPRYWPKRQAPEQPAERQGNASAEAPPPSTIPIANPPTPIGPPPAAQPVGDTNPPTAAPGTGWDVPSVVNAISAGVMAAVTIGLLVVAMLQRQTSERQRVTMDGQLVEAQKAADAARLSAQVAAAAVKKDQLLQRARVNVSPLCVNVQPPTPFGDLRRGEVNVVLKNYGHMPATKIRLRCLITSGTLDEEPKGEWEPDTALADLVPGAELIIPKTIQIPSKLDTRALPVVRGRLEYDTGAGTGWTTFCGYYLGRPPMRMPGEYNQSE